MYNVDLKNVVPLGDLTCLFVKATLDESNLWHKRIGHINFKTMNKLVKGNLVRVLPSRIFENNHTWVACQKGKQHRASCKSKHVSSICHPLQRIKIEFSVARTPQQNSVAERKNRTLIEVARTMLADSLLHIPFWAEAVNTSCLTKSMNYQPVVAGNQPTDNAGIKENLDADDDAFDVKENENDAHVSTNGSDKSDSKKHDEKAKRDTKGKNLVVIDTTVSLNFRIAGKSSFVDPFKYPDDPDMPELEDIVYSEDEEHVGAEADLSNLETNISVNLILTTRVHKDHPVNKIIGDLNSAPQTRSMARVVKEQGGLHQINNEDFHTCMFACFLSQEEPKKVHQEEGIDYDKVFAPVARIEFIRLFLAYASFMGFMVYQMDVKSAFLYGTIKEEVYVCQPLGFEDPDYPNKVYKVVKALYGLHQAPKAWYLKGKPHLGLWYPKDSPFNLVAYSDSDYVGASLERKSTTGGFRFLGCRLISWQCKNHTVVATSSTEVEYVATASYCAQVLWIQNQLLDYGKSVEDVRYGCKSKCLLEYDGSSSIWIVLYVCSTVLRTDVMLTILIVGEKEVQSCVLTMSNSASFETRLRFVSRRCCVLPKKTSCVLLKEDIQCAGFDHDHYQEAACAYHEEHMMHDCVQLDHVVDSHDEYTNDSNIIMCDQYVRDNEVPVVHSGASSV
nr:ribonuclease H-like domain-containing protein [Tanacetum cinerariifolium]